MLFEGHRVVPGTCDHQAGFCTLGWRRHAVLHVGELSTRKIAKRSKQAWLWPKSEYNGLKRFMTDKSSCLSISVERRGQLAIASGWAMVPQEQLKGC